MKKPILRPACVLVHRWVGLLLAGFLVIAGLTGALLVWYEALDESLAPGLFHAPAPAMGAPLLDPLALRDAVQAARPDVFAAMAPLDLKPGRSAVIRVFGRPHPETGELVQPAYDQVFVDPYNGRILGQRTWGDITEGLTNLMPFIYRLHYTLALGHIGGYIFGVVALLWTLDCFVGAYLTFPTPRPGPRTWFARWGPAWRVRLVAGGHKLTFDLHRASGLWTWVMMVIVAWSGVAFNLAEVYDPVMKRLFAHQADLSSLPKPLKINLEPAVGWNGARDAGRRLMAEQAALRGFTVLNETLLAHDPRYGTHGVYRYMVKSSRDIRDGWGSTQVIFDADTGELLSVWLPTGAASGDTIRTWITSLHMAALWGMPFKLFMSLLGMVAAALSLTGVAIWWKKARARSTPSRRQLNRQRDVLANRSIE